MLHRRDPLSYPEPLIRRVYSYAAYRLGDGADAEDATSEAFARALRYRQSFDPRSGTAQAWLLGIARRVIDDQLAQQRAQRELRCDTRSLGTDNLAESAVQRLTLRAAMEELSQAERDMLALRYGADLTSREIADIVGAREIRLRSPCTEPSGKLRKRMDLKSPLQEAMRERD